MGCVKTDIHYYQEDKILNFTVLSLLLIGLLEFLIKSPYRYRARLSLVYSFFFFPQFIYNLLHLFLFLHLARVVSPYMANFCQADSSAICI